MTKSFGLAKTKAQGTRGESMSEAGSANNAPTKAKKKDPLEGVTLETILVELEKAYGWEKLGALIPINCFLKDPSVKSSLTFLRKTPWARTKVEKLYIDRSPKNPRP